MSLLIVLAAFAGGLFTAWVVGVNNSSTFGPVNAAGAITVFRSSLVVGLASFLGAITQGGSVANTMGNKLIAGVTFDAALAAIILLTASALILVSTLLNYPMPSAFTLIGSTIGTGIAAGGAPDMSTLQTIIGFWLAIPFIALFIGYTSASIMRRYLDKTERSKRYMRTALLILGTYTAYTAGANRAGLPIGPLMNIVDVPLLHLLIFAGLGMILGAWTGSPRIIQAVSRDYSKMGPRRAIAALLSASLLAQAATIYGVPISFNQTVIFSVIGSGLIGGGSDIGKKKIFWTVSAWIGALFAAAGIAYTLTRIALGM